jgi:hypothetical protein
MCLWLHIQSLCWCHPMRWSAVSSNKHINSCPSTCNIFPVAQHQSTAYIHLCWLPDAGQFRKGQHGFFITRKGSSVGQIVCDARSRTARLDTLTVTTPQHAVLETPQHCIEILFVKAVYSARWLERKLWGHRCLKKLRRGGTCRAYAVAEHNVIIHCVWVCECVSVLASCKESNNKWFIAVSCVAEDTTILIVSVYVWVWVYIYVCVCVCECI